MTITGPRYIDRQLSPTYWERVLVREDGVEVVQFTGTLAEVLDSWVPLVIPKRWLVGCDCQREDCPTPVETPTGDRKDFIRRFVEIHDAWVGLADSLHIDAGGRSACGWVQPEDVPGHAKKRLVRPDWWDTWKGKQCSQCIALVE